VRGEITELVVTSDYRLMMVTREDAEVVIMEDADVMTEGWEGMEGTEGFIMEDTTWYKRI